MNSRVMILLAVLLLLGAGIAGYLGYKTTQEAQQAALQAEQQAAEAVKKAEEGPAGKVPVVVLRQDVPAYKKLSADDLTLDYLQVEAPRTYRTIEEVLDQPVQTDLKAGELLQISHLQPGGDVARLLKAGERAVAIPVDEVVGGGGFVQPGDWVDVLLFLRGENGARDSAQVVMQSLRVIGFGAEVISPDGGVATPEEKSGRKNERARARTAVLAVPEAEVTRVLLANSLGTLRLTIRPPADLLAQEATEVAPVDGVERKPGIGPLAQPKLDKDGKPIITAVPKPAERHVLTSSVLQPAPPPRAAPRAAGAPKKPAEPPVLIYRGLEAQQVKP